MALRESIDYTTLKVKITFPNGETKISTFREVQAYALQVKDLSLCPSIIDKGEVHKGSLVFNLC